MGIRRKSRESALQALFSMDIQQDHSSQYLDGFCRHFALDHRTRPFFSSLVRGVWQHKRTIDHVIERYSSNWKMQRMCCVDRNILRLAVYELLYLQDVPFKVTINEAIDIGKKFGTAESGAFINGILDAINMAWQRREIIVKPDEPLDAMEMRCPRLGGPVPFSYCRSGAEDERVCWKILDCWWQRFDVESFLKTRMSPQAFEALVNRHPPSKIAGILELIEKAQKNS